MGFLSLGGIEIRSRSLSRWASGVGWEAQREAVHLNKVWDWSLCYRMASCSQTKRKNYLSKKTTSLIGQESFLPLDNFTWSEPKIISGSFSPTQRSFLSHGNSSLPWLLCGWQHDFLFIWWHYFNPWKKTSSIHNIVREEIELKRFFGSRVFLEYTENLIWAFEVMSRDIKIPGHFANAFLL